MKDSTMSLVSYCVPIITLLVLSLFLIVYSFAPFVFCLLRSTSLLLHLHRCFSIAPVPNSFILFAIIISPSFTHTDAQENYRALGTGSEAECGATETRRRAGKGHGQVQASGPTHEPGSGNQDRRRDSPHSRPTGRSACLRCLPQHCVGWRQTTIPYPSHQPSHSRLACQNARQLDPGQVCEPRRSPHDRHTSIERVEIKRAPQRWRGRGEHDTSRRINTIYWSQSMYFQL